MISPGLADLAPLSVSLDIPAKASEEFAYSLGIVAFLWGYAPRNLAALFRTLAGDTDSPGDPVTEANRFYFQTAIAAPGATNLFAPSTDTLAALGWLDLRGGPVTLRVPEMGSRYYSFQFVSAYFDTFGYASSRDRRKARGVVVYGPGQTDRVPGDAARVDSPTPWAYVIGRIGVGGEEDVPNVLAVQRKTQMIAPSGPGGRPARGLGRPYDGPLAFFHEVGDILAENPPLPRDGALVPLFREIGLDRGFDPSSLDAPLRRGLARAASVGPRVLNERARTAGKKVGGWSLFEIRKEYFGTDYLFRSVASYIGPFLGISIDLPAEAYFPQAYFDGDGDRLDSSLWNYILRFEPDGSPPVQGFWSLTAYDRLTRQIVDNPIRRYAISDRTPGVRYDSDGSLPVYIQHTSPGVEKESNWLPTPRGPMYLTLRMYVPQDRVLSGLWVPPPVVKSSVPWERSSAA